MIIDLWKLNNHLNPTSVHESCLALSSVIFSKILNGFTSNLHAPGNTDPKHKYIQ